MAAKFVNVESIGSYFESLTDPRHPRNRKHLLGDVIVIAVCGILCGGDGPTAIECSPDVLKKAEPHVFRYYRECNDNWEPDDPEFIAIESPANVLRHVQFGSTPVVKRRAYGDKGIYISLDCNCDWEPEHGLQLVFKNGLYINKVGPFDGHLTNSDAYGDDRLEEVICKEF